MSGDAMSNKPNRGLMIRQWGRWFCVSGPCCKFAAGMYELSQKNMVLIEMFPEDLLTVELMLHGY